MPILKRRQGQVVLIGPDVKITIIQTQRGAVTLDVEAPPSYKIRKSDGQDAAAEHPSPALT